GRGERGGGGEGQERQVGGIGDGLAGQRERGIERRRGAPRTMSVPTRSQSRARFSLRIHAWRSVKLAGNGVPGGTISLGAVNQKKSPLERMRRIGISVPHRGGAELP